MLQKHGRGKMKGDGEFGDAERLVCVWKVEVRSSVMYVHMYVVKG